MATATRTLETAEMLPSTRQVLTKLLQAISDPKMQLRDPLCVAKLRSQGAETKTGEEIKVRSRSMRRSDVFLTECEALRAIDQEHRRVLRVLRLLSGNEPPCRWHYGNPLEFVRNSTTPH